MTEHDEKVALTPTAWANYWRGSQQTSAYTSGGAAHPLLASFWLEYLTSVREKFPAVRLLDVASGGGGTVLDSFSALGFNVEAQLTCVDQSVDAIQQLTTKYPRVRGIVADVSSLPASPGEFDIVTSQFGAEYAGQQALEGLLDLPGQGGQLALVLHYQDGLIFRECEHSALAVRRLLASELLPLSVEMFKAGFEQLNGPVKTEAFRTAALRVMPAFKLIEGILDEFGEHVAGDTIITLYTSIAEIQQNLPRYEPAEVLDWLVRLEAELPAYIERMESMQHSALSRAQYKAFCTRVLESGFNLLQARPLRSSPNETPLAWVIVAERG